MPKNPAGIFVGYIFIAYFYTTIVHCWDLISQPLAQQAFALPIKRHLLPPYLFRAQGNDRSPKAKVKERRNYIWVFQSGIKLNHPQSGVRMKRQILPKDF